MSVTSSAHMQVQPIVAGSTKKVCATGLVLPEYFLALGRKLLVWTLELRALTLTGCSRQLLKTCSQATCIVQPDHIKSHGYTACTAICIYSSMQAWYSIKVDNESYRMSMEQLRNGVELGMFSSWLKFVDRKLNLKIWYIAGYGGSVWSSSDNIHTGWLTNECVASLIPRVL